MKITHSPHGDLAASISAFQREIDEKAGEIRETYVPRSAHIADEYRLAAEQAQAFAASGYSGIAPEAVASWANAAGLTDQESADNILATKAQFEDLMGSIRSARLEGKAEVARQATVRAAFNAKQAVINQLESMRGPE